MSKTEVEEWIWQKLPVPGNLADFLDADTLEVKTAQKLSHALPWEKLPDSPLLQILSIK